LRFVVRGAVFPTIRTPQLMMLAPSHCNGFTASCSRKKLSSVTTPQETAEAGFN